MTRLSGEWRQRRPSITARRLWMAVYLAGFMLLAWRLTLALDLAGRSDLTEGSHPLFLPLLAVPYWCLAAWHWRLWFPADSRPLPYWAWDDDAS